MASDRLEAPAPHPLRVLVIDDSAVVREVATAILGRLGGMFVTRAADPIIAMDKMRVERPDVILLDLEMPRMDGLAFLRKLMAEDPLPVVVCSGLASGGTDVALRALEEGAVEVIAKPKLGVGDFLRESARQLIDTVRAAAQARRPARAGWARRPALAPTPDLTPRPAPRLDVTTEQVVCVGASTGGTEALREILEALPPDTPGFAVVQHMPPVFTAAFAARLDRSCRVEVREAVHGDRVRPGCVLIAPGDQHMRLRRSGATYVVDLARDAPVSGHRPSVDVLFRSAAAAAGRNAVGVIMTGMGADGADGLAEMRRAGAFTLAQDEATCVVFGMPKEAIERGAVEQVVALPGLATAILRRVRTTSGGRP